MLFSLFLKKLRVNDKRKFSTMIFYDWKLKLKFVKKILCHYHLSRHFLEILWWIILGTF